MFRYYLWVSQAVSNLEQHYAFRQGPFSLLPPIMFVLITAPIWLGILIILILPVDSGVKYVLWMLFFLAIVISAFWVAYQLSKQKNPKKLSRSQ